MQYASKGETYDYFKQINNEEFWTIQGKTIDRFSEEWNNDHIWGKYAWKDNFTQRN